MALTKYARLEVSDVLDLKGSSQRLSSASLSKLAEFEDYRTEDGYLYARIRAISSRVNRNHDGWPSVELAGSQDIFDRHHASGGFTVEASSDADYGFSTFLGKPIFVDHHNSNPDRARGVIVDAKLHVEDTRTASTLDPYYASAPDNHKPPTWVELLLEVDAKSFPRLAKAIIEGAKDSKKGIDGFSMGCNVEMSKCSHCGNEATSPDEYCEHIRQKGRNFPYTDPRTGKTASKKTYEDCYGIQFFEISAVFDPADETALTREVRASVNKEGDWGQAPDTRDTAGSLCSQCGTKIPAGLTQCSNCGAKTAGQFGIPCQACKGLGSTPLDPSDAHGTLVACRSCQGKGTVPDQAINMEINGDGGASAHAVDPNAPGLVNVPGGQQPQRQNDPIMSATDTPYHNPDVQEIEQHARKIRQQDPEMSYEEALQLAQAELENRFAIQPDQVAGGDGFTVDGLPKVKDYDKRPDFPWPNHDRIGPVAEPLRGDGINPEFQDAAVEELRHRHPTYENLVRNDPRWSKVAGDNPPPQSELLTSPEPVNTLRDERVCPVCGETMDDEECPLCGYVEEPQGFDNPDLGKAQEADLHNEPVPPAVPLEKTELQDKTVPVQAVQPPRKVAPTAHVNSDMPKWTVLTKTTGRIKTNERPIRPGTSQATGEPNEQIISDQVKPVTSSVRTAQDFFAAAGRTTGEIMSKTADAASGAPEVATPDTRTDVVGVGGVADASNEAASKADAQVDVAGIGGTGVENVSAENENVNVEQGNEHSKNIEAIPTETFGDGSSAVERQADPVSSEPFPASADGVKKSHDDAAYPKEDGGLAGGNAVQGVQPVAEQFGERVDVLDHTTSPSNNSGPTKTWSGTGGNGVTKQVDPVTPESIATEGFGKGSSAHLFAAFQLADLEVDLGLLDGSKKFERVAQLEQEEPTAVVASLEYARRVKTAGLSKGGKQVTARRLPSLTRSASAPTESETARETDESLFL